MLNAGDTSYVALSDDRDSRFPTQQRDDNRVLVFRGSGGTLIDKM